MIAPYLPISAEPTLRWLVREDMPQVMRIDRASFARSWDEEDFIRRLRDKDVIGLVADCGCREIAGYLIYRLKSRRYEILRIAVCPTRRREGIGRSLVAKLQQRLCPSRRTDLGMNVAESNLAGQLFLRALGFECNSVARRCFGAEDGYRFVYGIGLRSAVARTGTIVENERG